MRMKRPALITFTLIAALACLSPRASALKYHERQPWMVNVGIGIGRGNFNDVDESQRDYRNGAVPQMRFGRMLGRHLMVSANYQGWILEFDRVGDVVLEDAKIRRSLQDLTLGLAWFPGDPESAWGGLYIRAAAGMGWSGTAIIPVEEGGKQEHGERIDDWGTGYLGEIGYDFWISNNATVGLSASYNYFDIQGEIVETAWFTGANLTLSLFF
jgi:hypothetical protein